MIKILTLLCIISISGFSQTKKDGTPDMRYKANKEQYGSSYSTPSYSSESNTSTRYQSGYVKDDGTYVQPHYKTNSNSTNHDNFSTEGNSNNYTSDPGYRAKDYSTDANNYGANKTIYTGPQGGQYYINDEGNKVYVPKR